MRTALTIAGSDPSGGAGIQADIKTMTMHGVYAMSVITALTAQNTMEVKGIMEVSPEFLDLQLEAVLSDIMPDAVKLGMVSSVPLIGKIAEKLRKYEIETVVLDPVMVSTSGSRLLSGDAIDTLREELLPLAAVITPNIPETEVLAGMTVRSTKDMETAAERIYDRHKCAVLCKGGHGRGEANDLLMTENGMTWFEGRRIDTENTHGTGCTLSSAIAANLAKGRTLEEAVRDAKAYVSAALEDGLDLGHGSGPLNHAFSITAGKESI